MISFLKSFLSGEKTPEEQALLAQEQKQRDVMKLAGYEPGEEEEEQASGCSSGGCGGCACR